MKVQPECTVNAPWVQRGLSTSAPSGRLECPVPTQLPRRRQIQIPPGGRLKFNTSALPVT